MNTGRFLLQHVELCWKGQLDMEPWAGSELELEKLDFWGFGWLVDFIFLPFLEATGFIPLLISL